MIINDNTKIDVSNQEHWIAFLERIEQEGF